MPYCAACGAQVNGTFCQKCGQPSEDAGRKSKEANPELALLQRYANEIQALGEQLADAPPERSKPIQKELGRKLEIYEKQLQVFKTKFPDAIEGRIYESSLYGFQA